MPYNRLFDVWIGTCKLCLDPPLTLDEARVLVLVRPAFDDRFIQVETYTRVYRRTGVCWCPECRARRGEK